MVIVNGKGKLTISLDALQRLHDNAKDKVQNAGMKDNLEIGSKGDKITITQHSRFPEGNSINHVQ
jgi:hypothetical protein